MEGMRPIQVPDEVDVMTSTPHAAAFNTRNEEQPSLTRVQDAMTSTRRTAAGGESDNTATKPLSTAIEVNDGPSPDFMNRTANIMVNVQYPTAPEELYNLMFDSDFLVHFLEDNQKVWNLEFEEWQERNEDPDLLMRDFHYTRPNSGVGPKEVYCEEHEENQHRDDDLIETETTTNTPFVTYGKAFHVVTHTSITRTNSVVEPQGCVLNVTVEIVWTGWCPFKGMIEGRVIDGQKQYSAAMDQAIREELQLRLKRTSALRTLQRAERSPARSVRFFTERRLSFDTSSDEKSLSERDPSWMEKQQTPEGPYIGLQNHLQQRTWASRLRMLVLMILLSCALALFALRLYA